MERLYSSGVCDVLCTALHPHTLTPSPVHRHSISHTSFCPGGAVSAVVEEWDMGVREEEEVYTHSSSHTPLHIHASLSLIPSLLPPSSSPSSSSSLFYSPSSSLSLPPSPILSHTLCIPFLFLLLSCFVICYIIIPSSSVIRDITSKAYFFC